MFIVLNFAKKITFVIFLGIVFNFDFANTKKPITKTMSSNEQFGA